MNYSADWHKLSAHLRKDFPPCLDPLDLHPNDLRESEEVHHNIPSRLSPELTYAETNLIPLCRRCHEHLEKLGSLNAFISPELIEVKNFSSPQPPRSGHFIRRPKTVMSLSWLASFDALFGVAGNSRVKAVRASTLPL